MYFLIFLRILQFCIFAHFIILSNGWSASTSFIVAPPISELTEICGKCRIRVGNGTTELFSFNDGSKKRFLFVCPKTQQLRMLNENNLDRTGQLQNNAHFSGKDQQKVVNNSTKVCRIVRWKKYPACNLHKIRSIPRVELHRAKYGRARTNIAQMGFVAKQPDLWSKRHPNSSVNHHKWFWYFALRLNGTSCRLAKLPTGATHIILDLGVQLVEMAQPLFICPLLANGGSNGGPGFFGCNEPHIFLLGNQRDDLPLELGFSYDFLMPKGNSEFRVNPLESEYLENGKNVRILLEEQFAGKHSFMEFAPYCDYHKSFAQIQPFNALEEKKEEEWGKSIGQNALSELQQGLSTIKSGFKSAKNALEKAKRAIEG